ncbi:MAG: TVP38/TMEM64 family protein [Candidatus Hydrogenedentes bacterium]|nr:TVP38/TMEM64 family protein [Candidatus Hydrogenedentota bacterium]
MRQHPAPKSSSWPRLVLVVGIPLFFFTLSRFTPFFAWMTLGLEWIAGLGAWGFFAFTALYVIVCVSAMPDVYTNLAGGMIWGPVWGALAVSAARVIGGCVTFLLVRTLLRERVERWVSGDKTWRAVDAALETEGFKLVLLLRLCPLFPVNLLNFALGATRIPLASYAAATFFGLIPRTLAVAYVGAGGRSLTDLATGQAASASGFQGPVFWTGLACTMIAAIFIAHLTRRTVRAALAAQEQG